MTRDQSPVGREDAPSERLQAELSAAIGQLKACFDHEPWSGGYTHVPTHALRTVLLAAWFLGPPKALSVQQLERLAELGRERGWHNERLLGDGGEAVHEGKLRDEK